jgi:hypothetical protein
LQLGKVFSGCEECIRIVVQDEALIPVHDDRIDRCDLGEGLRSIDRPGPLTPTLSHKGRGGSPPLLKHRVLLWSIASRSLSSGAHSRDPLARNHGKYGKRRPKSRDTPLAPACCRRVPRWCRA